MSCEYHACLNAAAMVRLLPGPGSQWILMVEGFRGGDGCAAALSDRTDADVALADEVRHGGTGLAPALFDRDPDWAPFYCSICERAYCAGHWHGQACPFGHRT